MLKHLIDRPVAVTMAMLVVVVLGIVGSRLLPVSLIPEVDVPYITVQVSAPDLSAREIDENVLKPLSQQLVQLPSLEDMVSETRDGSGLIRLTFSNGADIGYLFIEVNEKIDRSMGSFHGVERPKVLKAGATDIPAFFMNVTTSTEGSDAYASMSDFAKEVIARRLEQLPEVAMVDISGTVSREILIVPDESRLTQAGITPEQFENAVKASNVRLGSLTIRDGEYRYNVKFSSSVSSAEDIASIWFKHGDKLFQIRDVASVAERPAPGRGAVRSDSRPAVSLAVIKQSEARMSDLRKSVAAVTRQLREDYPELSFTLTRDQTQLLEYSINSLIVNVILGVLLACLVIFLFMKDFRSPTLVAVVMPVSLIFSMLLFYLSGLSLNVISLSGLILGVGMMADNAIILVDNITSRWRRGDPLREAVLKGTSEVAGPMLSSVLTTCAVFIPLVFLGGLSGAMFRDQALAVTIVLASSYLVTVTAIPVYYYAWYRRRDSFKPSPLLERLGLDNALQRWDDRTMDWFLRHRGVSWCILAVSTAVMALCLVGMPKERLPVMTRTEKILKIDWNEHISLEESLKRVRRIESEAQDFATQVTSLLGEQQFVLGHSGSQSMDETAVYFDCGEPSRLASLEQSLSAFMAREYPSAVWSFEDSDNLFDMVFSRDEAPLVARFRPVSRPDVAMEPLRKQLSEIRKLFPALRIPDVPSKKDVLFIADPKQMALYDISYAELMSTLRNALNGNLIFTIVEGNRSVPVLTGYDSLELEKLLQDAVIRKKDFQVPAYALMRQTWKEDLKTIISGPEGNYYPLGIDPGARNIRSAISTIRSSARDCGDFDVSFSGSWFSSRRLVREMLMVLLVALALLYLILASQFESLLQPLIILLEVIVDIAVSLAIVWALGVSLNIMTLIGLVVITGIVINDSILKIDTINKLHRSGTPLREAVMTASSRRMKSIIMTSLTTILAVCPFLAKGSMGADLQYPMSLVIVIGMTVGTLVSLFVVPSVYYSIYSASERE